MEKPFFLVFCYPVNNKNHKKEQINLETARKLPLLWTLFENIDMVPK